MAPGVLRAARFQSWRGPQHVEGDQGHGDAVDQVKAAADHEQDGFEQDQAVTVAFALRACAPLAGVVVADVIAGLPS